MGGGGLKCIAFCWNFIFALGGMLIFFIALSLHLNYSNYANISLDDLSAMPLLVVLIAVIVTIFCCLGCCGILTESVSMIVCYILFVLILLILELTLGIYGYRNRTELMSTMHKHLNGTFEQYNTRADYHDTWMLIQSELECCGVDSSDDWKRIYNNDTLPSSCCTIIVLDEASECTQKHGHPEGCFLKLQSLLTSNIMLLSAVSLGVAVLEIFAILFSCCLCCKMR